MASRTVTIGSTQGLHARPASMLTKAAAASPVPITLETEGKQPINPKSILAVMSLGLQHGTEVTVSTEEDTDEANAALDSVAQILTTDHDA